MKERLFIDVRFTINERKDGKWDLFVNDKDGKRVTVLGPLSWDDVVRECNRCIRLRHDFIERLKVRKD